VRWHEILLACKHTGAHPPHGIMSCLQARGLKGHGTMSCATHWHGLQGHDLAGNQMPPLVHAIKDQGGPCSAFWHCFLKPARQVLTVHGCGTPAIHTWAHCWGLGLQFRVGRPLLWHFATAIAAAHCYSHCCGTLLQPLLRHIATAIAAAHCYSHCCGTLLQPLLWHIATAIAAAYCYSHCCGL